MGNSNSTSATSLREARGMTAFRVAVLICVFAAGAVLESVRRSALRDPEIWRHIRIGSWILANISWPHTGLFSQARDMAWRDFNWGYDVLSAAAYRSLGLRAIPGIVMIWRVLVGVIVFLLAGGRRLFWLGVTLSVVAQYVMSSSGPSVVLCSVVLFSVEVILLQQVRASENMPLMYVLPVLFLLWANLEVGFVYGLAVYAAFVVELLLEKYGSAESWQWVRQTRTAVSVSTAAYVGFVCVAATLVNPYGVYAYAGFFADQSDAPNVNLPGYAAMNFHRPQDYSLLLLAMAAFLALGLTRCRRIFPLFLLIGSAALAFRAERAGWLLALASVAIIGEAVSACSGELVPRKVPVWSWQKLGVSVASAMLVADVSFVVNVPRQQSVLLARMAEQFPVRACDYIRQHDPPQPLFNAHRWGSFLIWYLPEYPVAIDERRGLYPEDDENDYAQVMKADIPYQSFASMQQAQTLLMEKGSVMGEALRGVAGFQVAYEDDVAIVLVHPKKE
jgi:hypothetical protein